MKEIGVLDNRGLRGSLRRRNRLCLRVQQHLPIFGQYLGLRRRTVSEGVDLQGHLRLLKKLIPNCPSLQFLAEGREVFLPTTADTFELSFHYDKTGYRGKSHTI